MKWQRESLQGSSNTIHKFFEKNKKILLKQKKRIVYNAIYTEQHIVRKEGIEWQRRKREPARFPCGVHIVGGQYNCARHLMCTGKTIWIHKGSCMYVMDIRMSVMRMWEYIKKAGAPWEHWQMGSSGISGLRRTGH